MLLILIHNRLKIAERILQPSLVARNPTQLKMRVGLQRVDCHRILEPPDGLRELPALLVNQAQLILSLAIVRIDSGRFQIATVTLPAAQSGAKIAKRSPQEIEEIQQDKRRRQEAQ